jgi:hypothetical protein
VNHSIIRTIIISKFKGNNQQLVFTFIINIIESIKKMFFGTYPVRKTLPI